MAASGVAAEDGEELDCSGSSSKGRESPWVQDFCFCHRLDFALTEPGFQASRLQGCRATLEMWFQTHVKPCGLRGSSLTIAIDEKPSASSTSYWRMVIIPSLGIYNDLYVR